MGDKEQAYFPNFYVEFLEKYLFKGVFSKRSSFCLFSFKVNVQGFVISAPGTRFPRADREPPRRYASAGSHLVTLFPQESRTMRSNHSIKIYYSTQETNLKIVQATFVKDYFNQILLASTNYLNFGMHGYTV
ncbi:hypothetical protein [Fredinandcohnia sp. 179-A 10B2 NHS]|uniref:hypothetical protein n=1 Tax=Fredinandcohnia sp. 179-A 10B2 NHS TaxID=3235176 RepID=UPI0039A16C5B